MEVAASLRARGVAVTVAAPTSGRELAMEGGDMGKLEEEVGS